MKIQRIKAYEHKGKCRLYVVCREKNDSDFHDFLKKHRGGLKSIMAGLKKLEEVGPDDLPYDRYHAIDKKNFIDEVIGGDFRLACFKDGNTVVIFTHGFPKKSQKTPEKDKRKAKKVKDLYFEAKKNKTLKTIENDQDE